MSRKGTETIDHAAQVAHEWVNELQARLEWADPADVLRLMRVTLAALRDRLGPEESAQLAAQLPLMIRGLFWEGWNPSGKPVLDRSGADFIAQIERHVGEVAEYRGPEDITTVFRTLEAHVSEGEIADVRARLPQALRALWPQ
ncbi:DUF2267 domain-containing protein [Halovulum dunhuangense]|uniref:DUF2267 domain-containing protein n=1 Tax=Halovulum dunhuangense TaxID=1505036 RepID=A0A849L489_9RHOB|nr:DUF2267 domain-containing protein [Halovulum dunhuangense]NNU81155.1 DUF2267 domain-containing protein [Halovulum dunhuangense]